MIIIKSDPVMSKFGPLSDHAIRMECSLCGEVVKCSTKDLTIIETFDKQHATGACGKGK
jgi:hypothetical protein